MNVPITPLSMDDTFQFSCSKCVPCFNECCRDLNQFLTPYDILRLKQHFNMTSSEFLAAYTVMHEGPSTGLPVISLKMEEADGYKCPFVTDEGCGVYENRPASCRTYPLARGLARSRDTGELTEHFALIQEPHCRGFEQKETQTVREWIAGQGIEKYNKMNDMMLDIISLKNQLMPGPLDSRSKQLFYLACYDLDAFRDHIFEKKLIPLDHIDPEAGEELKTDDEKLLVFGMKWLAGSLFGTRKS